MQLRTDLAIESNEINIEETEGVHTEVCRCGNVTLTSIDITTQTAAERLGKPAGRYVTAEGLKLGSSFFDVREHIELIAEKLRSMLPEKGNVLAAGLGNRRITPDSLGPACAGYILATSHIKGELAKSTGLSGLRSVSVISPGVLGDTGIEAADVISGIVRITNPAAVIVIDALAARSLSRLGNTVQICNTGISPGSGVCNHRMAVSEETLGVPVIGIGVPTVVDAGTLISDLSGAEEGAEGAYGMMVTPREIDLLVERAGKLVGMAVNCALQKDISFDVLAELVS